MLRSTLAFAPREGTGTLIRSIVVLTLLCVVSTVRAAESSAGSISTLTPAERALIAEAKDEIGKHYWVRGGTATNQVFCDASDFPGTACQGKHFGPAESERFTIEAVNTATPASRNDGWYRIRFDSGKIGYLNADTLRSHLFVPIRYQNPRGEFSQPIYELFFNERPEIAIARLQQRSADERSDVFRREQERMNKGAVRLGMTKQQVLNSSWGQPEYVHTSNGAIWRREQWVYAAGNLYFENGILTSIQPLR